MIKLRLLALLLMLAACDGDQGFDPTASGTDTREARARTVAESLRRWQELASENPGPYWYEEEVCGSGAASGATSAYIEVDETGSRWRLTGIFSRDLCVAEVDRKGRIDGTRYRGFDGTFEKLHEVCGTLLRERDDVELSFDAQGIVRSCWVPSIPGPGCLEHCGAGFYLRARGFGPAPWQRVDGGVP